MIPGKCTVVTYPVVRYNSYLVINSYFFRIHYVYSIYNRGNSRKGIWRTDGGKGGNEGGSEAERRK